MSIQIRNKEKHGSMPDCAIKICLGEGLVLGFCEMLDGIMYDACKSHRPKHGDAMKAQPLVVAFLDR